MLSIEVTHERGPGTQGSWVWIDAFDIENGSPIRGGITANTGRVEEDDPALLYTGHWYPNINRDHSAGRATMAMDASARVTIRFNGTGIAWNAYRDAWRGDTVSQAARHATLDAAQLVRANRWQILPRLAQSSTEESP